MSREPTPEPIKIKRTSTGSMAAIIIAVAAILLALQIFYMHIRDTTRLNKKMSELQASIINLQNSKTLRTQRVLSDVRYLIHLANLHLVIDHDPSYAIPILLSAQKTLSSENNPDFIALSQALSSDITALQALPAVDMNQAFSSLSTLIQQIQALSPIPSSPSVSLEKTADAMKSAGEKLSWHERIFASLKQLKTLFVIRHLDQPNTPIITADAEATIKQNIIMQLNMAQWALLHRDQKIYGQALQNVSRWLTQYFALTTQKDAIITQLNALERMQIQVALPTLNNTLKALSAISNKAAMTETIIQPEPTATETIPKKTAPTNSLPKSTPASVET